MKILILILTLVTFAQAKYQSPYFKKSGKFVQGHFKTESNKTRIDNFSTKGNVNPYTGKKGQKK